MSGIKQPYICPRCGQQVKPKDNFCDGCNSPLTWPVKDFEYKQQPSQKKKPNIAIIGISIVIAIIIFGSILTTLTGSRITKTDAPFILNMAENLPQRFKRVDATEMGISTKNMDLEPSASEVQLFISEEPKQVIYGFILISSNLIARCNDDALMKSDQQFKDLILKNIQAKATDLKIEITNPIIDISHPSLGDVCVFGAGTMKANGMNLKLDMLAFRKYQIYVTVYSYYINDSDSISLIPLGNEIIRRMDTLK